MNIKVNHLQKTYSLKKSIFGKNTKEVQALKDISFSVRPGERVGLIGLNGAGKSTLIKILCGVLAPTQGHVEIDGHLLKADQYDYKKRIGVLFGHRGQLWNDLTVRDSYDLLQKIYGIPIEQYKIDLQEYIEGFELEKLLDVPLRKLSLGQRMKCEIVGCLLHGPELLLLDEATLGLDIFTRELVLREIKAIQSKTNMTLLFTSHNLDDVENLCERILILDKGQILFDDSMRTLRQKYAGHYGLRVYIDKLKEEKFALSYGERLELDPTRRYLSMVLDEDEALAFGYWIEEIKKIADVVHFELQPISFESIIKNLYLSGEER